jgi:hypothetical protein
MGDCSLSVFGSYFSKQEKHHHFLQNKLSCTQISAFGGDFTL